MGQRISIYLSDEALEILDGLVKQLPLTIGFQANRSGVISDLLVQQGAQYLARLQAIREAIRRNLHPASQAEHKPIDPAEYERFGSMEEYAKKLGVGDE